MLEDRNIRLLTGIGIGIVASGAVIWAWRKRYDELKTMEWVEVGKVEDLMMFPIKSGGGYTVTSSTLTRYGMVDGDVVDRSFVIIMTSATPWVHVTQGMAPNICTIIPTMKENILTLKPLKGDSIEVDTKLALLGEGKSFKLKGYDCFGYDCGDDVATWLQGELYPPAGGDKQPPTVKLMYVGNPEDLKRPARIPPFFVFPQFKKEDMQVYHDNCAFHLFTQKSFDDFNSRLSKPITLGQMRPNIVVTGHIPYEEDNWAYVKIGNNVQLRSLKPRDTCARINIRPETGENQTEVLGVLKQYRVLPVPAELKEPWSKKPLFGLHMALDKGDDIKVGDKVWAVIAKPSWLL